MSSIMHRSIQNTARMTIIISLLIVDFALGKNDQVYGGPVTTLYTYTPVGIYVCVTHMHAFTHRDIHRDTNIMLEYF